MYIWCRGARDSSGTWIGACALWRPSHFSSLRVFFRSGSLKRARVNMYFYILFSLHGCAEVTKEQPGLTRLYNWPILSLCFSVSCVFAGEPSDRFFLAGDSFDGDCWPTAASVESISVFSRLFFGDASFPGEVKDYFIFFLPEWRGGGLCMRASKEVEVRKRQTRSKSIDHEKAVAICPY